MIGKISLIKGVFLGEKIKVYDEPDDHYECICRDGSFIGFSSVEWLTDNMRNNPDEYGTTIYSYEKFYDIIDSYFGINSIFKDLDLLEDRLKSN